MRSDFFYTPGPAPTLIEGIYDPLLVALSVVLAMVSAAIAFQLAHGCQNSGNVVFKRVALANSALILAIGTWGMHFIGMLANDICSSASYDPMNVFVSWLPMLLGSLVLMGSLVANQARNSIRWQSCAAAVFAVGLGLMHFSGVESLTEALVVQYSKSEFVVTWVLALVLCLLCMGARAKLASIPGMPRWALSGAAGILLGGTLSVVHYVGMDAMVFLEQKQVLIPGELDSHLIWTIGAAILVAGLTSIAGNAFLRYREAVNSSLRAASRLRTVLETSSDAMVLVDHAGIIVSVNPAGLAMYGYPEAGLVGQSVRLLVSNSYRRKFDVALQRFDMSEIARQVSAGVEVAMQRSDGSKFAARVSLGSAASDKELYYMVFIADISERVQSQKALKEREQQLSSLINSLPGASFRYRSNRARTPVFLSDGIEKITGWPAEAFMAGQVNYLDLIHPEDRETLPGRIESALAQGRTYSMTYRIYTLYGEERWVSENSTVTLDSCDKPVFIDGVLLDVTLSMQRSAELEGVVRAMDRALSIIEFDMSGNVLAVNDKFTELAGYTTDMMLNLPQKSFLPKTEEEMRNHDALWGRLRAGEVVEREFHRKHLNGNDLYVFSYYNPIFGPDGKPYKVMSFSTDLTGRYAMERDLRDAKEKAETAVVAKSAFLANMSHELRTPMNAILGFTDILLDEPMADEHKRYLRTVHSSAEGLLKLLNDILDTAKLDYGAVELEIKPFSLKDTCRQMLAMVAVSAEEKGLDLALDYPTTVPELYLGDRLRLQQVLTNLIGNAVKFTEAGSVRVVCRYEDGKATIAVHDTGIGIAPERLGKIFEPFVQADASMTRRFGGTGLGTTIARQLVELMGGRIKVQSEEGVGSEFRVEIPLAVHHTVAMPLLQSTVALAPMHLLLVDDVSQNLDLLVALLSKAGHSCVVAENGQVALEKFQQDSFDAVLMDLQMPVMDGLQATQAIRQLEAQALLPHTPVIAVTANAMSSDRDAAVLAGMDGFVSKPVQQGALYAEIRRVVALAET